MKKGEHVTVRGKGKVMSGYESGLARLFDAMAGSCSKWKMTEKTRLLLRGPSADKP